MFSAHIDGKRHEGYVASDMGIGGGDYIEFGYCLDCGQIQGEFPRPETLLEHGEGEGDDLIRCQSCGHLYTDPRDCPECGMPMEDE